MCYLNPAAEYGTSASIESPFTLYITAARKISLNYWTDVHATHWCSLSKDWFWRADEGNWSNGEGFSLTDRLGQTEELWSLKCHRHLFVKSISSQFYSQVRSNIISWHIPCVITHSICPFHHVFLILWCFSCIRPAQLFSLIDYEATFPHCK